MYCLRIEIAINSYCRAAVSLFDWLFYLFTSPFVVKCDLSQAGLLTILCGMSLFIVVVGVTRGMILSCVLRRYAFHILL
ncbi:unknown [Prevotella sp. CAG:487]|nr:unknown [Prevotella sp. CAG:487]